MLDSDDIRKFTTSLLTCIPLTSAFKPHGRKSYCPLSKKMQGCREKHNLDYICKDRVCKCSMATSKELYTHVYQESERFFLHKNIQNYLYRAYSNYYGRSQHHYTIVSAKTNNRMYITAIENDENMLAKLK